jgi:hypothetical protein
MSELETEPKVGSTSAGGFSAAQQQQISELVAKLNQLPEQATIAAEGRFRILCRMAKAWCIAPEEFRVRLMHAGMVSERASEIKSVLTVLACRDQFIKDPKYSWKKALAESREIVQTNRGLTPMRMLAAKLVGMMHRHGITRVTLPQGTFYLKLQPLGLAGNTE